MHYTTLWHENHQYRDDIMQAITERMNDLVDRFARTFVMRLDIRFPAAYRSTGASGDISKLMKRLVEIYTANRSDPSRRVAMHYVVVREQNLSVNPHYHLALTFDGSKIDNGWTVRSHAETIWIRIVGEGAIGCVHLCNSQFSREDGIKIQKPRLGSTGWVLESEQAEFHHARSSAIKWLSYLAKTDTKGFAPLYAKEFFCSRLSSS